MGVGRGGPRREMPADFIEKVSSMQRADCQRYYRAGSRQFYRWLDVARPALDEIRRAQQPAPPLMPYWESLHEDKYAAAVRAATVRLGAASVALMSRGAL